MQARNTLYGKNKAGPMMLFCGCAIHQTMLATRQLVEIQKQLQPVMEGQPPLHPARSHRASSLVLPLVGYLLAVGRAKDRGCCWALCYLFLLFGYTYFCAFALLWSVTYCLPPLEALGSSRLGNKFAFASFKKPWLYNLLRSFATKKSVHEEFNVVPWCS